MGIITPRKRKQAAPLTVHSAGARVPRVVVGGSAAGPAVRRGEAAVLGADGGRQTVVGGCERKREKGEREKLRCRASALPRDGPQRHHVRTQRGAA